MKTVVITGASTGIGRAAAEHLAANGWKVFAGVRKHSDGEPLKQASGNITPLILDVAKPDQVKAAVAAVSKALEGRTLDGLVNNAGGPPPGDFRDWDRDTWISAIDTNMLSAIELVRMTVDGMMDRGFGRIVCITSSAVRVPIPVIGLSNATRAGLTNFLFGLATQVSSKGVTINCLLPGPFDTSRLRDSKPITQHLTSNPVAGRVGDPAELGAMCAYLCSTQAGYITAQNILMSGGLYPGSF